ncbi:MAG: LysR family transcriptional regulator [Candidatus Marinarcus sp.]|uniref:LysR family transcriptional regulator n=1 Tax=Candidatus Marinarcus sp. TaxID=3100987 RepID=UPI003B0040DF
MDSSLLKVFVAVANEKSVSLGAVQIKLSQSNVTLRIKQLEKNLGYALFHRVPKGVILTKEGEKLYPFALEIVKKVEEAELYMRNISHQETLRIGTSQANAAIRLLRFIEKLKKKYPNMELEFFTSGTPQVIDELLDYKIDVAFITGNPNHKDIMVLRKFNDDLYLVESNTKKSQNCLIGYRHNSTHFKYLESYTKNRGNIDFNVLIIQNYEVMLGCVEAGMGKAFLSKAIIDKYGYTNRLKLTKLEDNECNLETHLVCRKDYVPMIVKDLKSGF